MDNSKHQKTLFYIVTAITLSLAWRIYSLNFNDVVNISLNVILCIGFTFTHMMEDFLNLAHISFAIVGAITSFYLVRFHEFNPYCTWPFSIFIGGALGVLLYTLVVHKIRSRGGNHSIILTFVFLAIAIAFSSVNSIFSYWVSRVSYSKGEYNLSNLDFMLNGFPGIVLIGVCTSLLITILLYFFSKNTQTGMSLRAVAEDENLSQIVGINSFRMHCLTWIISGSLSALAGSIIVLHKGMSTQTADNLLVTVMAGSVLGGLDNIFGAVIGGVFIAIAQKVLSTTLFWVFGQNALNWSSLYPLIFLIITLVFFPNGIINRD